MGKIPHISQKSEDFCQLLPKEKPYWLEHLKPYLGVRQMGELYNKSLRGNARVLRENMTKEERHLWYDFLKQLPVMVHRQKIIGAYIVDFYVAEAKLVIELDGSQHYDDEGQRKDAERDAFLQCQGLTVLRYANSDVNKSFQAVCQDIWNHLFIDK